MPNLRLALLAAVLLAAPVPAGDLDWWQVSNTLDRRLLAGEADLWEIAAQSGKAATPEQALETVIACARTGQTDAAIKALVKLRELAPDLAGYQVSRIYHDACDRHADWVLARRVVEIFSDTVNNASLHHGRLIEHWQEKGWSNGKIDAWLAARGKGFEGYWVKQRVSFRSQCGTAGELLDELAAGVRADPGNHERTMLFLDAVSLARESEQPPCDLGWMGASLGTVQPLPAGEIAGKLASLGAHEPAVTFYGRALARSLTDEEVRRRSCMFQAVLSEAHVRHGFTAHMHDGLARSLLGLGRAAEAQKHVEKAAAIREEHDLPQSLVLAGQVQAASGARVIEGRVREQEQLRKDDPRYWLERARYYKGREEASEEERALERALELCGHEALKKGKAPWPLFSQAISHYERFLERQDRAAEAVDLLRDQIRDAPLDSHAAQYAVHRLGVHYSAHLAADDAVCWTWLRRLPVWSHGEERLLWEMLQKAQGDEREALLERAEELADGAHPTRAKAVGWVLNRLGHARRSLAPLRDAVERTDDAALKLSATHTLFESYLACDLWREAEALCPALNARADTRELCERFAAVAALAARAGARDDALRLWRTRMGVDPMEMSGLDHLVRAGLAGRLRAAYAALAEAHPESTIGARAERAIAAASR